MATTEMDALADKMERVWCISSQFDTEWENMLYFLRQSHRYYSHKCLPFEWTKEWKKEMKKVADIYLDKEDYRDVDELGLAIYLYNQVDFRLANMILGIIVYPECKVAILSNGGLEVDAPGEFINFYFPYLQFLSVLWYMYFGCFFAW